jgi:hypothetical protein
VPPPPPSPGRPAAPALALIAAALCLGPARIAAAAPLARLVVHRAPAAADCFDAATLAGAVERMMQRPALDPASEDRFAPVYELQIFHSEEGYAAILQSGGLTRQLSDPGPTCAVLSEALALTLAILLESEAPLRPAPPPPPLVVWSPPPPPPAPPPPAPPPMPPPSKRWDVSIDAGVLQSIGVLTPLSWGFIGEVSLRLRAGSFGAGALWIPTRTLDVAPGTVELWLAAGTVRACGAVLGRLEGSHLSICAQPILGAIHGEGHGYAPDRQGTAPWFALGGGVLAEGSLSGPLGWSIRATVVVPLLSEKFTVDQRAGAAVTAIPAFEPAPVGILLGAGLRVAIP